MSRQIYIVMAVFRPDPGHLRAQMASFAAQTHRDLRLICVIADTVSAELAATAAREAGLGADLVRPEEELDAVRAFEEGLARALELSDEAEDEPLIALSDQDDVWHPERLARGVAELEGGVDLVHSDARVVAGDGVTVLHESMFAFERRHRRPGLRGLLYRNNITGMTVLMRRRVAALALPFPRQSGVHFYHDLWLGLLAAATGGVRLIETPLVDYRQHGGNAIGAVDRQEPGPKGLAGLRRIDTMWLRREAAAYALARYLAHSVETRLGEAVADGRLLHGTARLRPLRPFLRRSRGAGAHLWDACRLRITGKGGPARIAAGFALVNFARNVWTLREALGPGLTEAREQFDARLYSLSPGMPPERPALEAPARKPVTFTDLVDTRKIPSWRPTFTADGPSVTVLVPTLNPTEIFAGIVTALDIGLGLAARGQRVRFVATDLPVSSQGASRRFLLRRLDRAAAEAGAGDRISLHCGVQSDTVSAHREDRFLATAWWSAHIADRLIREHGFTQRRFAYLIQDFEPNFYAWGPEYADAMASYGLDFLPIFNTVLLRDYFAAQGFGFATPEAPAFHPSIDIARYARGVRPARTGRRRLALYGRPEVARNMYATAIEALALFLETEELSPDEIELVSVGLRHAPVTLPGGHVLESLGKLPWEEYPGFLLEVDLGLSLMHSPHPSHPPIEMAASGVRVVTNGFGPKDLGTLTPAILSVAPTAPALAAALSRGWALGPAGPADRAIDLTRLGLPPGALIDRLAREIAPAPVLAEEG